MSELELVETHVHLWDLSHPKLSYDWLGPDAAFPRVGPDFDALKRDYLADDFIAETRATNVTKAVHVQAALGTADPVDETEWLQAESDRTGFPHAAVVYADLGLPSARAELERHLRYRLTRGVRDFYAADNLAEPGYRKGYALLERYGLVASMNVKLQHMEAVRDLARAFPRVPVMVDHCGLPERRTDEYFRAWRRAMSTAAEAENVYCKISGLGMDDWGWTVESIRPWVHHCIDAFGPARCVFATNWPVDKLYSSYDTLVDAYKELVAGFSRDEQAAMFSRNAERLYRV